MGVLAYGDSPTDGGGRKNHGKPASPPTELGANKTSYASAKIGVHALVRVVLDERGKALFVRVVADRKLVGKIDGFRGGLRRLLHHFQVFAKVSGRMLFAYHPLNQEKEALRQLLKKIKERVHRSLDSTATGNGHSDYNW